MQNLIYFFQEPHEGDDIFPVLLLGKLRTGEVARPYHGHTAEPGQSLGLLLPEAWWRWPHGTGLGVGVCAAAQGPMLRRARTSCHTLLLPF